MLFCKLAKPPFKHSSRSIKTCRLRILCTHLHAKQEQAGAVIVCDVQAASSNSMLHPVTHPFSQPVPSASTAQQQYSSQQLFAQRQRGAMPQHIQGRFRGPCLIPAGHMKEVAYPVQGCNHLVLHSPQSSHGWAFRLLCASAPQGAVQLLVPPYVLAQGCCGRQQSAGVKC